MFQCSVDALFQFEQVQAYYYWFGDELKNEFAGTVSPDTESALKPPILSNEKPEKRLLN